MFPVQANPFLCIQKPVTISSICLLGCNYTYSLGNNEQIEFTSPNYFGEGYPLAQRCTWRFIAPEKRAAHVTFLDVDIEDGDTIEIQAGWDGGATVGSIEKNKPPNPAGYSPSSDPVNLLFVVFKSRSSGSSRKKSKGFLGIFTVTWSQGEEKHYR